MADIPKVTKTNETLGSTTNIADNYQRYSKYFSEEDNDDVSIDTFFQLLVAEMSKQDPLEPMSNTEFISQMANFTALSAQKDALYYQNANYAQSLVGKTVTVAKASAGKDELKTESGVVTSMRLSGKTFNIRVNGQDYTLANIMEVLPTTNPYSVSGSDGAFATSLIGKYVTCVTTKDGSILTDEGKVSRIEIKDNEITVIIGGLAYPLSTVTRVEDEEPTATGSASSAASDSGATNTNIGGKLPDLSNDDEENDETALADLARALGLG